MMISWKRYLRADPPEDSPVDALLRAVQLLLEALRLHAVEGDQYEFEKFQADLRQLRDDLGDSPSSAKILVTTGAAIKAFEEYQRRTSRFLKQQGMEYQGMMGMLTAALARISKGSEETVVRLQTLEKQIERTAAIEDIRVLKSKLGDCLDSLREESRLHREDADQTVRAIRQEMDQSRERLGGPAVAQPEESAESFERAAAIEAISRSVSENGRAYAAAFMIQRVALNTKRFGEGAGDCMIRAFQNHLNEKIPGKHPQYRWSEAGIVLVLDREGTPESVNSEVRRATSGRLEALLQIGARSVLLPIAVTSAIVPVDEHMSPAEIARQLDALTCD
jgi:hypothetical protein